MQPPSVPVCSLSSYSHIKLQRVTRDSWPLFVRIPWELFEMWASYRHCLNSTSWHLKVRANQRHLLQEHYITLLNPVLFQAQQKGCAAFCSESSHRTDKDAEHPDSPKCQPKTKSHRWRTVPLWVICVAENAVLYSSALSTQ